MVIRESEKSCEASSTKPSFDIILALILILLHIFQAMVIVK